MEDDAPPKKRVPDRDRLEISLVFHERPPDNDEHLAL
jgi:hypothetical protein